MCNHVSYKHADAGGRDRTILACCDHLTELGRFAMQVITETGEDSRRRLLAGAVKTESLWRWQSLVSRDSIAASARVLVQCLILGPTVSVCSLQNRPISRCLHGGVCERCTGVPKGTRTVMDLTSIALFELRCKSSENSKLIRS